MGEAKGVEAVLQLGDIGELVRHELDLLVDVPVLSDISPPRRAVTSASPNATRMGSVGGGGEGTVNETHKAGTLVLLEVGVNVDGVDEDPRVD